jgi:hypothetical protein
MIAEKYDRHLNQVYAGLLAADELEERRFYMNALLRVAAAVCYESPEPEAAYERACLVIKAAMDEGEATSN